VLLRSAGSVYTIQKNTEALVVVSKENGLEVNADNATYSTWPCLEIRMQDEDLRASEQ